MNRRALLIIGAVSIGIAAGFGLKTVLADGIPPSNPLYYAGTLTENGTPVNGARDVTVNLWSAQTGGTMLCQTLATGATPAQVTNGRFRIPLAAGCKAAVNQNNNISVEVFDGTTGLGRTPIGAVPYAVEADHAVSASNVPVVTEWQSFDCTVMAGSTALSATDATTVAIYRRVGDSAEVHIETVLQSGVNTQVSGMLSWSLPTGVIRDSTKGTRGNLGTGYSSDSVSDNHLCYDLLSGDSTYLYAYCNSDTVSGSTVLRVGYPSVWQAGSDFALDVHFPVQGWTSTTP